MRSRKQQQHMASGLRWVVALVSLFALVGGLLQHSTAQAQGLPWLTLSGRDIKANGQTVYLRGANFANIYALSANIGTGNPADVQHRQEDYTELKRMGGTHVRFGMSYRWYSAHQTAFWTMLDQQVAYARNAGLWFIPLIFTTPADCYEGYSNPCPFWDSSTEQSQLRSFWVTLATRYRNEPTVAGIDVLNEPTVGASRNWDTNYFWQYAETVRDAVLAVNPNLLVFIEAGSDATFTRKLGTNVVYQVHDYEPLALTHGAHDWTSIQCRSGARYPGTMQNWAGVNVYYDKNAFAGNGQPEANLRELYSINWAQQNNVPLYIGEWGGQSACPGWDQLIRDKADLYNQWGLHWSYYSWRANPGNFDVFAALGALRVQNATAYALLDEALGAGGSIPPTAIVGNPTATRTQTPRPASSTPTVRPSNTPVAGQPTATRTHTPNGGQPTVVASATSIASTPSDGGGATRSFVRALNLNGPAVRIVGNQWEASEGAANFTLGAGSKVCNAWANPSPATDANTTTMLRCAVETWQHNLTLSGLVNGTTYEVYVYAWQDWANPNPHAVTFSVNGRQMLSGFTMPAGTAGAWRRLGPWAVTVNDGKVQLTSSGDNIKLSGIELWRVNAVVQNPTTTSVASVTAQPPRATATHTALPASATPTQTRTSVPATATAGVTATFTATLRPASATPTVPAPTATTNPGGSGRTFVRGINLNGPAVRIAGQQWEAGTSAANFRFSNAASAVCNPWTNPVPATDADTSTMLRCSLETWQHSMTLSALENGSYEVYVYAWQDWANPNPQPVAFYLNSKQVQSGYQLPRGVAGAWQRLGPWTVTVSDGRLILGTSGDNIKLSGLELWKLDPLVVQLPTERPTSTPAVERSGSTTTTATPRQESFYLGVNVSGDTVQVAGNDWQGEAALGSHLRKSGALACYNVLTPIADAGLASVLRCGITGANVQVTLANVPAGRYAVDVYVVDHGYSGSRSVTAQGTTIAVQTQASGTWSKVSADEVTVSDSGTLSLSASHLTVVGVELRRITGGDSSVASASSTATPTRTVQSDAAEVTQSGSWKQTLTSNASAGSYLYTADGSLTLTFSGTQVDVLYLTHPALGSFALEVDGVLVQTITQAADKTRFQQVATVAGLPDTHHTLVIYPLTGVIAIDAFLLP